MYNLLISMIDSKRRITLILIFCPFMDQKFDVHGLFCLCMHVTSVLVIIRACFWSGKKPGIHAVVSMV